jgi:TRAP-type transport system periplasmic protein
MQDGMPRAISTAEASVALTELSAHLAAEHEGVKTLFFIATPALNLFFSKIAVRSPADMKGLRMRHNGPIGAAMLEAWGSAPAAIPPAELSDALSKGVIGGMLFNYEAAKAFQIAGSVKAVTPVEASAATFALVMNAEKYAALPADLRKLIDDTTGPALAKKVGASLDEAETDGRQYLVAANVQIVDLTPAERKAFQDALSATTERLLAKADEKGSKAKSLFKEIQAKIGAK